MTSLIKELLVSINQSSFGNLIYFYYKLLDRAAKAHIYAINLRRLRVQTLSLLSFQVSFSERIRFSMKKGTLEEELKNIDIDDIVNLEDLPRLAFIDEECETSTVVNWWWWRASKVLTKRRSQMFYKHIDIHSVKNTIGESISSISMWNIVNQLGKHDFSCA